MAAKYIIAANAVIPAKDGIHNIRETPWIPDLRFAASGMTPYCIGNPAHLVFMDKCYTILMTGGSEGSNRGGLQILGGPQGCLNAIGNSDFLEDVIKVGFHSVRTDAELVGNIVICRSDGNHGEYLDLSFG